MPVKADGNVLVLKGIRHIASTQSYFHISSDPGKSQVMSLKAHKILAQEAIEKE